MLHLPSLSICQDAAIAAHVIHYCFDEYTPFYTVHDCLISPATKAGFLGRRHEVVFLSYLRNPIHIINRLLLSNLFVLSRVFPRSSDWSQTS